MVKNMRLWKIKVTLLAQQIIHFDLNKTFHGVYLARFDMSTEFVFQTAAACGVNADSTWVKDFAVSWSWDVVLPRFWQMTSIVILQVDGHKTEMRDRRY